MLTQDTLLTRTSSVLQSEVDGDIVALDVEKGQCYGMNTVASQVWALLEAPMTPAQICARLEADYEVDEDTCRAQVLGLLEDLLAEGLVKRA